MCDTIVVLPVKDNKTRDKRNDKETKFGKFYQKKGKEGY